MHAAQNVYKAIKVPKYIIEPATTGFRTKWEGHHTTNPSVMRLPGDKRVFLGYRAGGDDDRYWAHGKYLWGSTLGLAILDARGERVIERFPLPIYKLQAVELPKNEEQWQRYQTEHADDIVILHDFRFFVTDGNIYLIHHDGSLSSAFDAIVRMPVNSFLSKVDEATALSSFPVEAITEQWARLWWGKNVWEPCGIGGTRLIFGSKSEKTDIVYFFICLKGRQDH